VLETAELSREARQHEHRALHYHWESDGSLSIRLRLPAEVGARVLKAIELAVEEAPPPVVKFEKSPSETRIKPRERIDSESQDLMQPMPDPQPRWSMRHADAMVAIVDSYLAHGAEAMNGGDRQQIVVHVDAQTLIQRSAGRCELAEGPSLAAETARRLACDASLVAIVEDERGEPLDVGRKTRTIPPAIRRALQSRDKGCRFPGCTHTRYVDGHHVRHWADGGETKLSNLVTLCSFHHHAVHEGEILVEQLDDGAWRFSKPGDNPMWLTTVLPGHTRPLAELNRERGLEITPQTAATRWSVSRWTMDWQSMRSSVAHNWPARSHYEKTFPRKRVWITAVSVDNSI
jgi:hypothetical protein